MFNELKTHNTSGSISANNWTFGNGTSSTARIRRTLTRPQGSTTLRSQLLAQATATLRRWRSLRGSELITKVITGVRFRNGIEVQKKDRQKIAA